MQWELWLLTSFHLRVALVFVLAELSALLPFEAWVGAPDLAYLSIAERLNFLSWPGFVRAVPS